MVINIISVQYNGGFLPEMWFDGTTIDIISAITVSMFCCDWWLCVAINIISVQYNGGFLPDIILLTQGYYRWGTRLNTM